MYIKYTEKNENSEYQHIIDMTQVFSIRSVKQKNEKEDTSKETKEETSK